MWVGVAVTSCCATSSTRPVSPRVTTARPSRCDARSLWPHTDERSALAGGSLAAVGVEVFELTREPLGDVVRGDDLNPGLMPLAPFFGRHGERLPERLGLLL